MRPVTKGSNPTVFTHWREARDLLIDQIGNYCSYCECPPFMPDIEHKEPKADDKYPERALEWDNLLLACGYCNSLKQDKDVRTKQVLFPDEKNTAWAFIYLPFGFIGVNSNLDARDVQTAKDTRDWLVELLRERDTNGNRDLRWQRRVDAWREATAARDNLIECDNQPLRRQIVSTAVGWGCYSVWMAVFANDSDMRYRLRDAFRVVRDACYDANSDSVPDVNI